jgi:hypothetical protein
MQSFRQRGDSAADGRWPCARLFRSLAAPRLHMKRSLILQLR